jgi:protein-S-isoprenylcysteine O-methyltransferase Ste14
MSLWAAAFLGIAAVVAIMGTIFFVAAGDVRLWQGWAFLATYAVFNGMVAAWMIPNDPALLRRRMRAGPTEETDPGQRIIMAVLSLDFVACILVPGLDHRFGWSHAPAWLCVVGDALVALSWLAMLWVFRENSFGAATIQIMEGQRVIDTGPYALVRHPMYAGASLLFVGIPLALGSPWSVLCFVVLLPFGAWRIFNEEALLRTGLSGYADYLARVRWRLVPGLW